MIEKNTVRRVLEKAVETGGDFAELFAEDAETNSISALDSQVESAAYSRRRGAGVRVFSGENTAYAYTADLSEEGLLAAARAAAAALTGPGGGLKEFHPEDYSKAPVTPFSQVDNAGRIRLVKSAAAAAKGYDAQVSRVTSSYMDADQRVLVANTQGLWGEDRRCRTRIAVEAVASSGQVVQTGRCAPGLAMGFEAYKLIDPQKAGLTAAASAVTMLTAPECPAGFVPVVIDGGFGGVIFHEACGHSLEATSVGRGASEFCSKLGQKIASDIVTAVDDGTLTGEWGFIRMDDEGNPSRRNVLIEKGVLVGYLVDRLGSRRLNLPMTGSSRRQSYAFAPTSRMTNTFIAPGKDDLEEMLATMGEGLYAKSMGGGSVNPLTGEFNFSVTEGYWIKDGKIFSPVRGATLVGKGSQVLLKIDRVGKKMWMEQGMCGSESGSVPTNVGQPPIRVSGLTVGGKGGKL